MKPFLIFAFNLFFIFPLAWAQPSISDSCSGDTKFHIYKEYSKYVSVNGVKRYKWDNELINCHMNMAYTSRIKKKHALRNAIVKVAVGLVIAEIGQIYILESDLEAYPEVITSGAVIIGVGVSVAATSLFSFLNISKQKKKYQEHLYFLRQHFDNK